MADLPTIPEFYRNKTVFITGGSGFIGKVLIEKLLRSCPDLKNVYVLLREKRGKSAEERVKAITDYALFDVLKEQNPGALEKIKPIKGDVKELNLGLSPEDRNLLINEINITFHAAASVRFDDSLTDSVLLNSRGTREVCKLSLEMKNLEVLVHISTTYCNTDHPVLEERLYPPHADWEKTIEMVESMDKHTLNALTEKYIHPLPNTYTFAKSLAEHVVYDMCNGKIPVVVFRPSIVISSAFDPFPGWIDNFNGPVGLMVASGKGIVRIGYCDPDVKADYVPVDLTVRAIIISSWKQATMKNDTERLTPNFYNGSNNELQPVTMGEMIEMGKAVGAEVPLDDMIWFPGGGLTKCYYNYFIKAMFYHFLPALVIDGLLKIMGKEPRLLKIQRKIFAATSALAYFTHNQWSFINEKTFRLQKELLPSDVDAFSYKEDEVDQFEYFVNSSIGARKYLLKEGEDFTRAKRHAQRMKILAQVVDILWYLGLVWLIFFKIDIIGLIVNKCNDAFLYLTTE